MLKNYFKTALRNLKKNKGFSFLNLIGLALGMSCAILIFLWVNDELSYNKFHKNYSNLYQVMEHQRYDGKTYTFAAMPGPFVPAIKTELPEVKYAARTDWGASVLFNVGEKSIYERGLFTEPDFLKMFSFELIKGDINTVLKDPATIVITDKMAEKFFPGGDAMGKTIKVDNDKLFTINGIVKDPPLNSSIKFSWLAPFKLHEDRNKWLLKWDNNGIQNFVQLKEGADVNQVNKKIYGFIQSKDSSAIARPFLFTINDWRLRGKFEEGKQVGGRIENIRLFSIIALLIIIIACINFMNLATARSEQRAREVGVRKVMGAGRSMLIRQFMSESVFMALFAMVLAGLIVFLVLPSFNELVEKKLQFSFTNPVITLGLPLIALLCGVIAGSYPSFYLSSFNPVSIFRGIKKGGASSAVLIRKGLVITQFVVSIVLIISTVVIYQQIQHVKNRELGFSKNNVLFFGQQGNMREHFSAIRQDLVATGMIENAAIANSRVLQLGSSSEGYKWKGKDPNSKILITTEYVSPEYISTMRMKLKSGRDFYQDYPSDTSSIIINETLAAMIGTDPVGSVITNNSDSNTFTIVGVVKDFLFNDMYGKPDPLMLFCQPNRTGSMLIRIRDGADVQQSVQKIESVLAKHNPGYPFDFIFMDEQFDQIFRSEMMVSKLSRLFAGLTILISCLGLFGLAAYTAERRTKEIGIRKVLGATVRNVLFLLSSDFLVLVLIAFVIAFPLAWWAMHSWLQDFAYRININWEVFLLAGAAAIFIALFTVSFQAIKAALSNPVRSLRTE